MKMRFHWQRLAGTIFLLCILIPAFSQSKKQIRDMDIVSRTVEEYFIEEGIKEPVIESIQKFDEEGELVELKEFNRKGEVQKWEKYVYDEDGNLVEEIFLDDRGKIEHTEKNIWENGLRTEKQYYNSRDKLYKKKVYVYEYRQ
jgi:YD repeat-containing protein